MILTLPNELVFSVVEMLESSLQAKTSRDIVGPLFGGRKYITQVMCLEKETQPQLSPELQTLLTLLKEQMK